MARLTILVFVPTYLPGFKGGGPVRSVSNLVEDLGREFDFKIVTADRDLGDRHSYPNVEPGKWVSVGKGLVCYLPPEKMKWSCLGRFMRGCTYDVLYLNSFFHPTFSILPLLLSWFGAAPRRHIVLAPRGEFSKGALSLKSAKKKAFLLLSRVFHLHRSVIWHASSEHEARDIRTVMGAQARDVRIAPAMPRTGMALGGTWKREAPGPLRIVFLSRIVPMKNLLFALDILSQVRAKVVFTIYGPKEDQDYWKQCESSIAALPRNVEVIDCGPLHESEVPNVLGTQDLLFLPTHGENFGHVIAEALGAGVRILLSDRTMWRGLEAEGVGYDLPLDSPERFVEAVEAECRSFGGDQSRAQCQAYLERKLRLAELKAANRHLFDI